MKVELIGGPADGKTIEVPDDWQTINVATAPGPTPNPSTDGDLVVPYLTTTYRFRGSITDDGTRRFTTRW
jgi:hypothetical protein